MKFVDSSWKQNHCFGAADGNSSHQSFESQESLGICTLMILPRSEDFFFESLQIRIWVDLQESDNAGEICEFVLDGGSSNCPASC